MIFIIPILLFLYFLSINAANYTCKTLIASPTSSMSFMNGINSIIYGFGENELFIYNKTTKKNYVYTSIGFTPLESPSEMISPDGVIFLIRSNNYTLNVWNRTSDVLIKSIQESRSLFLLKGLPINGTYYYYVTYRTLKQINYKTGEITVLTTNSFFSSRTSGEYDSYQNQLIMISSSFSNIIFCDLKNNYAVSGIITSSLIYSYLIYPSLHIITILNYKLQFNISIIDYKNSILLDSMVYSSGSRRDFLSFGKEYKQVFLYKSNFFSLTLYNFDSKKYLQEFSLFYTINSIYTDTVLGKLYISIDEDLIIKFRLYEYNLNGFSTFQPELRKLEDSTETNSTIKIMIYSDSFEYIIAADNKSNLYIYNISNRSPLKKWDLQDSNITKIKISTTNSNYVLASLTNGTMLVINLKTFYLNSFTLHNSLIYDFICLPKTNSLAFSVSEDQYIKLFDYMTGRIIWTNYSYVISSLVVQDFYEISDPIPKFILTTISSDYFLRYYNLTINSQSMVTLTYIGKYYISYIGELTALNNTYVVCSSPTYLTFFKLIYETNGFDLYFSYAYSSYSYGTITNYDTYSQQLYLVSQNINYKSIYMFSNTTRFINTMPILSYVDYDFDAFFKVPNSNLMLFAYGNTIKLVSNYTVCDCITGLCGCESPYAMDIMGCVSNCSSNKILNKEMYFCECPTGLYYDSGLCLKNCQTDGYYVYNDSIMKGCLKCYESCSSCTDFMKSNCTSCNSPNYFLYENSCYLDCPDDLYITYGSNNNNTCEKLNNDTEENLGFAEEKSASQNVTINWEGYIGIIISVIFFIIIIFYICSWRKKTLRNRQVVQNPPSYLNANSDQINPDNVNDSPLAMKSDLERENPFPEIHPVNLGLFPEQDFDDMLNEENKKRKIEEKKENVLFFDQIQETGGHTLVNMKRPQKLSQLVIPIYNAIMKYNRENSNFVYFKDNENLVLEEMVSSNLRIDQYRGFLRQDSIPKIIKIYKNFDGFALQNFLEEITIMKTNPNYFVQVFGVYCGEVTPNSKNVNIGIIYEEMTLSLEKLLLLELNEDKQKILVTNFLEQVIKMHQSGISHNNLKSENVFTDNNFAKISFTDLKLYQKFSDIESSCKETLAPENFFLDVVTPSKGNDFWSVGVLLIKIMLKKCIFNVPWIVNLQNVEMQRKLIMEKQKHEEKVVKKENYIVKKGICNVSSEVIEKIEGCFMMDKMKRIKLEEILIAIQKN